MKKGAIYLFGITCNITPFQTNLVGCIYMVEYVSPVKVGLILEVCTRSKH